MKKNTIRLGYAALGLALFAGCGKTPEACFSVEENLVDQNEVVAFSNCSIYQESGYLWDFGDGTTSEAPYPSHSFTSQGEFLVSLTARGSTSATDDTHTEIIVVGKRFLTSIQVDALPADNNGTAWDASDAPDVVVRFVQNGTAVFESAVNTDLALSPPYTLSVAGQVELLPANLTVEIVDNDGATSELMSTFDIDLNAMVPVPQQQFTGTATGATWTANYNVAQ